MFRLLIFFIIMVFMGLIIWALHKIISKKPASVPNDIDKMISELKKAIEQAELDAEAGMVTATARLQIYKHELEKLQTIKNKTKNL